MTSNSNPYKSPTSLGTGVRLPYPRRLISASCPVCGSILNRLRLVLPFARCSTCNRRIRLRNSAFASSLSTITAIICFASLLQFEATPRDNGLIFGIHALVFVSLGTLWFHCFGRPSLAGWFWHASPKSLSLEREKYHAETTENAG